MNRIIMLVIVGSLCILLFESGVKRIDKEPSLTITPSHLELFADQRSDPYVVDVAYTLNIPAGFIPSCARMVYQPYFLAAGHRYDLTPLVVFGRENIRREERLMELEGKPQEYPNAMELAADYGAMKVKLSETVPFEVWMAQSKLRADVTLEFCDREKHIEVLTLADGVVWFPLAPGPALVKYVKETEEVQKRTKTFFIYPSGRYLFESGYDGNAIRMKNMMKLMDSLQEVPEMRLKKIVITGSSSPSGNPAYDEWLAQQRALRMKQRFVERRHIDAGIIVLKCTGVDWNGLYELLKRSDVPDKEDIYPILEGNHSAGRREMLLQKLPQYGYLQQNLFPDLQRVTCEFYYMQKEEVTKVVPE